MRTLTWNLLPWLGRSGGMANNRPAQHRETGNNSNKIEDHDQPKNPGHQDESNKERDRTTEHQSQRNPQKQRGEPGWSDLRRRRPSQRVHLRRMIRKRNRRGRRSQ